MSAEPEVSLHENPADVAEAVADHLLTRLAEAQLERGEATVVLTGGSVGIAALRHTASHPLVSSVDWTRVNVWWGDERFVKADNTDRNERQAREAFLDHVSLDPQRVHPMGSADAHDDVESAAAAYADELAGDADRCGTTRLPPFDVLLLGVGPDAHIASLFPEMDGIRCAGSTVTSLRNSPKPPPQRISLTLESITSAADVVLAVAGEDKAGAVGLALAGASPAQVPAAGARGTARTLWMIDNAASACLPDIRIRRRTSGSVRDRQ